jgi:hypothetical protein
MSLLATLVLQMELSVVADKLTGFNFKNIDEN